MRSRKPSFRPFSVKLCTATHELLESFHVLLCTVLYLCDGMKRGEFLSVPLPRHNGGYDRREHSTTFSRSFCG
jgi:hypothetical protein